MGSSSSTCNNLPFITQTSPYFFFKYGRLGKNDNPILCCKNYSDIDKTDCYSYQNKIWKEIPSLTSVRGAASMSLSPYPNSSILRTGGQNEFANTGEYLTENGWQNVSAPLPVNISYHCAVLVNSTTILIIGGDQNGIGESPNTYLFNTENEKWIEGPSLRIARENHGCAKIKEDDKSSAFNVIVVAGWTSSVDHRSVEILGNLVSNWEKGPELPLQLWINEIVEDPSGGVLLIGRDLNNDNDDHATLLHLAHAKSEWVVMPQKRKLKADNFRQYVRAAFYVPDEITNCTQEN